MKKKYLVATLILTLGINAFASESDDLKFIDELYKQKQFDMAIVESKDFLEKYPNSKYNKNLLDRIAKVYFLQDNYEQAIKYFKILLMKDNLSNKEKNEINYYLVKSYASIEKNNASNEYLNLINPNSEYYDKAILDTGTIYLAKENYSLASESFQILMNKKGKYYNDAILNMALLAYNQKNYPKCIEYISLYTKESSNKNNPFMNYLLGSAYYKLNDINSAIQTFSRLIDNDKNNGYAQKAVLNLIEIYSNKGDLENTKKMLALLNNPSYQNEGIRILGDSYATKGDYNKAIGYYQQITDLSNPKLLYSYGFSLFKLGKLKEAQNYFESLKNSSYYNQAMYYIFAIDYKLKNYKKILNNRNEIKKVIVNQQDTESINLIIANAAYELGQFKLSRDYYGRMYATNPSAENLYRILIIDNKIEDLDDMQIRFNEYKNKFAKGGEQQKNIYLAMGELYYKKGKIDEAVNVYKEYLGTNQDFDILNNLITALLAQQKYDEMLTYLDQMDDSLDSNFLRGVAFVGMGKYQEANEVFNKLEQDPNITPVLLEKIKINRIRSSFLQNNYQEAIKYANEFLTAYPNSINKGEALDKMAISYFRVDDFENSRNTYAKLKEIPEYAEYAQFQIADSYYAQNNFEKALENYSLLAQEFPNGKYTENANYWYLNALVNLGKIDEFESEKQAFLQRYPNSAMKDNILILSGQIYEKTGDKEKVLNTYKELYSTSKSGTLKEEAATKIIDIQLTDNNIEQALQNVDALQNEEMKSYYKALIFEKQNKTKEAMAEYKKLANGSNGDKYVDFASMKLATYYFDNKMYDKAKTYYTIIDKLNNSQYKDLVLLQLSTIDELEGKNQSAYRGYTKGFVMYKGQYSTISKFKAAQMAEKLNKEKEAEKLYKELYALPSFEYKPFVLEKLTYFSLKRQNKVEAKKYYTELQKLDKASSQKYDQFFN